MKSMYSWEEYYIKKICDYFEVCYARGLEYVYKNI